jgi:hypothetical protein
MTVQCCKCKCIRHKDGWIQPNEAIVELVSSTYCPECLETSIHEMRREGARLARFSVAC